jgi:hypothetical protein
MHSVDELCHLTLRQFDYSARKDAGLINVL